jgi:hypothetical protein
MLNVHYFETGVLAPYLTRQIDADHRFIMRVTGDVRTKTPYIFRKVPMDNSTYYMIRSPQPINEHSLAAYKKFSAGQEVTLQVKLSPTRREPVTTDNNAKPLKMIEKRLGKLEYGEFFLYNAAKAGLDLDEYRVITDESVLFAHRESDPVQSFPSTVVMMRGKIIDLEKWKHAFLNGIGRRRAYGFGLIHVPDAPAQQGAID